MTEPMRPLHDGNEGDFLPIAGERSLRKIEDHLQDIHFHLGNMNGLSEEKKAEAENYLSKAWEIILAVRP